MKIRNGFVSNSSSSSFIIIGREILFKDINPDELDKKKYSIVGKYFNEGHDLIDITDKKVYTVIKKCLRNDEGQRNLGSIYESVLTKVDSDSYYAEFTFNQDEIEKMLEFTKENGSITFIHLMIDYHRTTTLRELIDTYVNFSMDEKLFD